MKELTSDYLNGFENHKECDAECNLTQSGTATHELATSRNACSDILTNLAPALVSGSHVDLHCGRDEISASGIELRKSNSKNIFRGNSAVSKTEDSKNYLYNQTLAPDGGWGWMIVLSSFCIAAISGASCTGFSMYYPEISEAFNSSKATAGWIGSLHLSTGNFLGIFFSLPVRKYGSQPICVAGALITSVGYVLSSLATSTSYLYFSYGLIAGLGIGMTVLALFVIVQQYFDQRRAIAAGLSATGFSVGSLSVGPVLRLLIDSYTWRGAMLIQAAVCLQIIPFALLYRPLNSRYQVGRSGDGHQSSEPRSAIASCWRGLYLQIRASFDFSLMRDISFSLYLLSQLFVQISFQTFYQHTPSRALHYGVDRRLISLLPLVSSIGTGVSRFSFSFIANASCTDRMLQYTLANALAAITQSLTFLATDFTSLVVLCTIEGTFFGAGLCILTTLLVDLKGVENIARAQALMSVALGAGMLISVPFSGALFDITQNYNIPFAVTGALHLIGALLAALVCIIRRRKL